HHCPGRRDIRVRAIVLNNTCNRSSKRYANNQGPLQIAKQLRILHVRTLSHTSFDVALVEVAQIRSLKIIDVEPHKLEHIAFIEEIVLTELTNRNLDPAERYITFHSLGKRNKADEHKQCCADLQFTSQVKLKLHTSCVVTFQ